MAKLLRLVERGIVLLVDRANDARLGPLVRALCAEHPDLRVVTEAPRIEEAPSGSVIVLATRPEDASWLNLARPIFAERSLRLVLWSKAAVTAELARRAPDFFDWIARRFECPAGSPAFAVLFDRPGALTLRTAFSYATLPYACLRALPASLPPAISVTAASLVPVPLLQTWLRERAVADAELTAWTASFIASRLQGFPTAVPPVRNTLCHLAAHFVHDIGCFLGRGAARSVVWRSVSIDPISLSVT